MRDSKPSGLRPSEEARYRLLYEDIPLMYFTLDEECVVSSVNRYGAAELGYVPDELVGRPVQDIFHEEDRKPLRDNLGAALRKPGEVGQWELRKVRKDGSVVWVHEMVRAVNGADGKITVLVTCKDISRRKEAERKVLEHAEQLQRLTLELTLAEEKERRRIAVGLHDDIGHTLALVQLKLSELRDEASGKHSAELKEIAELVAGAIGASRSLVFDLASPVLYELGLEAALQAMGEKLMNDIGMGFHFETDGQVKRPPGDMNLLLFRIARELLVNIVKHADARNAKIGIRTVGDHLELEVADDGAGFDAADAERGVDSPERFGLFSIRERLEAVSGHLTIEAAPNGGSRAVVAVPIDGSIWSSWENRT